MRLARILFKLYEGNRLDQQDWFDLISFGFVAAVWLYNENQKEIEPMALSSKKKKKMRKWRGDDRFPWDGYSPAPRHELKLLGPN